MNEKIYDEKELKGKKAVSASFLESQNGPDTIAALYYANLCEEDDADDKLKEYVKRIVENSDNCLTEDAEDEILYGNAGYLYCLLTLLTIDKLHLESFKDLKADILEIMEKVCVNLIEIGKEIGADEWILLYKFPRNEGTHYFGGAHGLIGVLYILLNCWNRHLPSLEKYSDVFKNSLDYLVKIQFESGNFPSSLGSKKDKLVHFCHGAPGAIPVMLLAYEIYKDETYLESALKAGE